MKVAIMQPYIFPYVGYFQLINAVDIFVVYDNIQFTKKGWINRNRMLVNGKDEYFTIPLKKASDYLNVDQRILADSFSEDAAKILRKFSSAYRKAPYYQTVFPLLEEIMEQKECNLFRFIFHSIQVVCNYLGIETQILVSSSISIDHSLKAQQKVIELCKSLSATTYINPIGGIELYSKEEFSKDNIQLGFLHSLPLEYRQFNDTFIPWLSILDVMMFNSKEEIKQYLDRGYTII